MATSADVLFSGFRQPMDLFVEAAEAAQLAMIFTDAQVSGQPVVFANDSFLELTGRRLDAVLGKSLQEIIGITTDRNICDALRSALASGAASTWEMQFCGTNGTGFLARIALRPIHDEAGAISYNMFSFVDLDGKCDHRLSTKFRAIYENTPGFIATSYGPEHRFSYANASYRTFVGHEQLVGISVAEAMPEIVDQGIIAILDEVYRSGQPYLGTDMPLMIGGPGHLAELRYIDVVYQPMRNAAGEVSGLFCEGYDVTAKHQANAEIADLQSQMTHLSRINAMGAMAATLAHELNQPLCAISNYVAGVRSSTVEIPNDSHIAQALEGIDQASHRAADIILHLRDLTKRRKPVTTTFTLKSTVDECIRTVSASNQAGAQFVVQIAPDVQMTADKITIQQVIINLLTNASDAVQKAARQVIRISAQEDDDTLIVSVTDTGAGVALEAAETIFSWSESSKIDGMGLGLSICRTILEMHQGKIWLEKSDADGSEFCFSLPRVA